MGGPALMPPPGDDLAALFERVPLGWSEARFAGRRYGVTRSLAADGRAVTLYAEELGGRDVISANLYLTAGSQQLKPCEMPAAKVLQFLRELEGIPGSGSVAEPLAGATPVVPNDRAKGEHHG